MPIGALSGAGRQVFRILGRLRDELKVNSTCGASNVSFGLPNREGINGTFLSMAIASGLTSAITNPNAEGVRHSVMAADVLMGNDQDATRWIRQFRTSPPDGEAGGRRLNRRRGPGSVADAGGNGNGNGDVPVLSADVPGVDVPGLDVPARD
jgi:5-methyltetrahydrofolate--homocysteine methyltransferase